MYISNIHILRPQYEKLQDDSHQWILQAYKKATQQEHSRIFHKIACKSSVIEKRGHVLRDFCHHDWEDMEVYRLHEEPRGCDLTKRMDVFQRETRAAFAKFYENTPAPSDLIHVTCTGYVSPSAAQEIASDKNWNTTITHAYHMGCYASIPACRMATGFLKNGSRQVDVVHSELCCLHFNPQSQEPDQIVVQSLFADGFAKYTLATEPPEHPHLQIQEIREQQIPRSTQAMQWSVSPWGFKFILSKEIPDLIASALVDYMAHWSYDAETIFAVHPGGPKILDQIQRILNLQDSQLAHSRAILKNCGNMSSATLPHIWESIIRDTAVPSSKIISLAFGPGLTIAGALMHKRCP